ncbi:MAG: alpha/beta hydrolase [Gammaproteobacteria bacterium]|nr:alpha/beta hydrolase [Gammaproteobacteria bacterium]
MTLETIELITADKPDASVIWLHGLGADGHDFEALVPELKLPDSLAIRFIFPHAPYRPITLNNGYVMRGWYDIKNLAFGADEDQLGIHESAQALDELIDQEISRGISSERIILAGFSQGGAIVLHTALRSRHPLAGTLALSTYVPLSDSLASEASQSNKTMPLFMAHGLQDDIVNYKYGAQSRMLLMDQGYKVDWHDYPMSHSVCMEEISDIRHWIIQLLGDKN